jgi:hypothetical protein
MQTPSAIVWFRSDLRLVDNPALAAACASGLPVLCLFIHEEHSEAIRPLGGASRWRLNRGLQALALEIERRGGELHFLRGAAEDLLPRLAEQASGVKIFWNRRYEAGEIAQDMRLKALLRASGHQKWRRVQSLHAVLARFARKMGSIVAGAGARRDSPRRLAAEGAAANKPGRSWADAQASRLGAKISRSGGGRGFGVAKIA